MAGQANPATVFVVDDDAAVREYLRWLIDSAGWNVETFASAQAFLDTYDPKRPGCLVLDVRMPVMNGFDLQAELAARKITIPIIMMTGYAQVPMAVRAMRAGAVDFIQKPFSDQDLLDRIQEGIQKDTQERRRRSGQEDATACLARLTPRQRQVLDGLLAGKQSKVIAADLGMSPRTVDVHRYRIMQRMKVNSLPDLFRVVLGGRTESGE